MNRLLSMLGLARRAGKLKTGYDATVEALKERTVSGVLLASDISEKTAKNVRFEAEKVSAPVIRARETIEEISRSISKKAGIIAVLDHGFFKAMSVLVEEDTRSAENECAEKGQVL